MPLEKEKSGCYNKGKKKHFQSPFHFLISLFSWTPRDRLVNDPGALHCGDAPTGFSCTAGLLPIDLWVVSSISFHCAIIGFLCENAPTGNTCTAGLLPIDLWVVSSISLHCAILGFLCEDAPTGNACTAGLYSLHHWVPLGIVSLYDASTGNAYAKNILTHRKKFFYGTTNHSLFIR